MEIGMILKKGDLACMVAPASHVRTGDEHLLDGAVSALESWGLRVEVQVDIRHHFYLAGTDESRLDHLCKALHNPLCKVIFCTRGGYGTPRLLRHLAVDATVAPKIVVGYSDISALHMRLLRVRSKFDLIHGPNVATRQFLGTEQACDATRESLREALFSPRPRLLERVEFLRPGRASGLLTGGCLSLVVGALGTPWSLVTRNRIVFLEDTAEAPYRIDRMLTHLRNAGKFSGIRGLVFGEMKNCKDPHNDVRDVLRDIFCDAPFPVAFGLRSGHGDVNLSLRLGVPAHLDAEASAFGM